MLDFLVGNDTLSAIVAFGLVLIPAIIIHELGHFLAAKAVGITILEFGVGFPPRMLTLFTRGETEYTLNWLPIGGFVRPLGEDFIRPVDKDEEIADRQEAESRLARHQQWEDGDSKLTTANLKSVEEATPWQRIFFMAAGAAANLLTAMLLFVVIGLTGAPSTVGHVAGVVLTENTAVFAEAGLATGDIILTIDDEYFDSADEMLFYMQQNAGKDAAFEIQREGAAEPEAIVVPLAQSDASAQVVVFVSGVAENSPAAQAGLLPDDLIIAFNGQMFDVFEDLQERTQHNLGQTVTLTVLRDGTVYDLSLVPRTEPPAGEGAMGISIIPAYRGDGIVLVEGGSQQAVIPLGLGDAIGFSFERIRFFVETMVSLPAEILQGTLSPEETRLMGPVAISQFGGIFLQESIEQRQPLMILNYIAIISIALGFTNLLPLPALDGGRIVFVLLEIIRGRPISREREGLVHIVGMALLLSLMVITLLNDISNPITDLLP